MEAPNLPTPNAFTALQLGPVAVNLRLTCHFGPELIGKVVLLQGVLNGLHAVGSVVNITAAGFKVIPQFNLISQHNGPVAYSGGFEWKLAEGGQVIATLGRGHILNYTPPPAKLWPAYGVSVSVLRHCLHVWDVVTKAWLLPDFYYYTAHAVRSNMTM